MAFNINQFKNQGLTEGGARPSLFEVILTLPAQGAVPFAGSESKFRFTCRAAQLPAATIGSIDVGYFGRMIKLAGDRTFTDWTVTVMNDEDFLVRGMFEKWSNSINRLESNVRDAAYRLNESSYKGTASIFQFSKTGQVIASYDMVGLFPTAIDAIDLNWETQNQVETFGVTFAYDYWLPGSKESANAYRDTARTPAAI